MSKTDAGKFEFPKEFPAQEAQVVAMALVGQLPKLKEGVRCGWAMAGYAADHAFKDDQPLIGQAPGEKTLDKVEVSDLLQRHCMALESGAKQGFADLPWGKILPVIIQLLQSLVAGGVV